MVPGVETARKPQKKKSVGSSKKSDNFGGLSKELLGSIHNLMVKSRVLEERLIKIYKTGEAFFWIGAPGEEAFGVPLGMLAKTGQGLAYDYHHLHYRCTPTLVAMGMNPEDSIRLIMNKKGDVCTGGRNFSNHYCFPEMNVTPVSSPIEIQYGLAIGTSRAQKRHGKGGVSIVTGGDAGTAEGDFASCLIWASRPNDELPILITVQNNGWGISTSYDEQHGEEKISDRGKAFGIRSLTIDGNDPVESYIKLKESFDYIRKEQKPVLMEAYTSRMYGHSSGTGANLIPDVVDPLKVFEERLLKAGVLKTKDVKSSYESYDKEFMAIFRKIQKEEGPTADTIWDHTYVNNENADWRSF
ncbi:MAG: thiamine pyrophosphate-dependent dehydrogenase E1 component subunit alpha [Bdellovibrionales bacterium]